MDATLIAAAPSTKNRAQARDPEMHQSKKGKQWYFGMMAHVGVDVASGLVHTLVGTAGNVADISQAEHLLHGQEREVYADAGYTGVDKREELKDRTITWRVAMKRGRLKAQPDGPLKAITVEIETLKARVRARVEHVFHIVKNRFGYRKVRYRGLAKNTAQLYTLFGLANLVKASAPLRALRAQATS